jgi:acyl transferase domain-containing protein/thioesterase domain-containing protein
VLGLIRGTAVNSDGTSNGLAAPNGPAQQQVIRRALAQAGLSPADVDVVEGHGTATQLGDPIEVQALLATYGQDRRTPALLGSVKSNIGHSQAAAGVAGVIKMVQAIEQAIAPRTLNVAEPSRHVDWSSGAMELLTEARSWPETGRPRRAAVSSFGIGGTNAHVILEQAPAATIAETPRAARAYPWLLSGADEEALRAQARTVAGLGGEEPTDVAFSLATTRSALAHRAAVLAGNQTALEALANGKPQPDVVAGVAGPGRLAFLFSGQGSQRPHMGQELRTAYPAFDVAFRAVCEELDPRLERPLSEVIRGDGDLLDRTDFAQAGIFAFEVAMCRLLETFGVRPDYVAGHSIGEVTAAHVAGVLTLADAAALVATRGALMSALPGGAMASVSAGEDEVAEVLNGATNVVIAAVNAWRSVVVSGTGEAVTMAMATFTARGWRARRLRVSHAFHSPLMDPMLNSLGDALRGLSFGKPTIPLISTVTGRAADGAVVGSPEYWVRQVRAPVRFADAVRALGDARVSAFVEVGPSAVLAAHVEDAVATSGDVDALLGMLGRLHVRGVPITWPAVFEGSGARVTRLPTYPFQRRRYWLNPPVPPAPGDSLAHPVLSHAAPTPGTSQIVCSGYLSLDTHPWLGHHVMGGQALLPATAFTELALRAAGEVGCDTLEELAIVAPLAIPSSGGIRIQVTVGEPGAGGGRSVDIHARPEGAATHEEWTRHATGTLTAGDRSVNAHGDAWPPAHAVDITGAYAALADTGIGYGPAFQCVRAVWRDDQGLYAHIQLPDSEASGGFVLHPALLDAALHVPLVAAPEVQGARLPFTLSGVRVVSPGGSNLRVHVRYLGDDRLSLTLTNQAGALVAEIASVTTRAWQPGAGDLYRLEWIPAPAPATGGQAAARETDVIVRIKGAHRTSGLVDAVHDATAEALGLLRKWSADQAHVGGRLVVVTEKATVEAPDLVAAAVWGLVRSAQAELGGQLVLADLDGTPESAAALPHVLASGQTVVAVRAGAITIPRLTPVPHGSSPGAIDTSGTILITGGTGALGSLLSRHIVSTHQARHLLLVSRAGENAPGARELRAQLASHGADVRIEACDASDRAKLEAILASASPPVSAVLHVAGVVDDAVLDAQTRQRVSDVLRPKADAAWHLHELLPHARSFVLFSSAAGMLGNRGQAGYAAGNCFLDALARLRTACGLPAVSLAWGPWQNEAGMVGTTERGGPLAPITDQQGLDLFDTALRTPEPVIAPLLIRGKRPFADAQAPSPRTGAPDEPGTWQRRLAALPLAERRAALLGLVRDEVGTVLGYDDVPDGTFPDLGLDSFTGVLLRNRLGVLTGLRLPGTMALDHPSVPELADYLLGQLAATPAGSRSAPGPVLRLASLYQRVCQSGHTSEAAHLLATASLALPSFGAQASRAHASAPERLATGPAETILVCFPDFFPRIAGISVYSALAAEFDGERDVFEIPYPVAAVPEDFPALAGMHAETVREHFGDRPVVLVGYSAGGCTAHAVAARLNTQATGLVLIDTYPLTGHDPDWLLALPAAAVSRAGTRFEQVVDDTAVAAMGAYLRIATGWRPSPAAAPTLFLRAQDPAPQITQRDEWRASWPLADHTVDIPGNHLELLSEHAPTTATAIRSWLRSAPASATAPISGSSGTRT